MERVDLSDFQHIGLQRTPGMGFCINNGQIITAQLTREMPDGSASESDHIVVESDIVVIDESSTECISPGEGECQVSHTVEPFVLSTENQEHLESLLSSFPDRYECGEEPRNTVVHCDFCRTTTLYINTREYPISCCVQSSEGGLEEIQAVIDFLDSVVSEAS